MTRTRFAVAILLGVAFSSSPAAAQPKGKGPPVGWGQPLPLKGIGKAPEHNAQQAGAFWADRLVANLDQLKHDVAVAKLPVPTRRALVEGADATITRVTAVEKALGQNNRKQWYQAYGEVEGAMGDLGKLVAQVAKGETAILLTLDRAKYATQQLGVAISVGDNNADQTKRVVARLAAGMEEQAERLRATTAGLGAPGRPLEREAAQFVRLSQGFAKEAAGNANLQRLTREFGPVSGKWGEVNELVGKTPNLPPVVRYQTTRVDGLERQIAALLGVKPPQPGIPIRPPTGNQRTSLLVVGADAGMDPRVVVYSDDEGTVAYSFYAYNRALHKSGIRVAAADLNGDGLPEVVTVNGGRGHARVKVFDGRDADLILTFDGFDQKVTEWGYFVAATDLTPDGRALLAIAPDVGGPAAVEVYDLAAGKLVGTVQAFGRNFTGGVRIAWGDVNGDGSPDLITAHGPGQIASGIRVFDGKQFDRVLLEFHGVDDQYKGGLFVAAADLSKNNHAEIVVGLDAGARPLVRVFDGTKGKFVAEYEPFPSDFRGGVRVAMGDPDDGARLKIICAPGPGGKDLPIRLLHLNGKPHTQLDPFSRSNKGMFVGSR